MLKALSFKQVIICFKKNYLINENSKHQKPILKQITMTKIQNSKQIILQKLCPMALSLADQELRSDMIQLGCMFWSLKIEI
jgi:hypothetical protein